ncbi:MAG: HAD family phosphatase, partial [Patescibacteria group bacterium]
MIKGIIYDLDDLMVNSIGLHEQAWDTLLKSYNHEISDIPASFRSKFVGMRIIDIIKEIMTYLQLDADLQTIYQKRGKIFIKLVEEKLEMLPGLIESLNLFKNNGLKIALASSGTKEYINLVLEKFSLQKYFDIIITGDDVKLGKPDPETYLVACQKLNLTPNQCLVLEDATNGIKAAKTAGCKCLAIKNPYTPPQDLTNADAVLNSLL